MCRAGQDTDRERGMTLVEVLMVVFIIGLASGIVALSIPQRPTAEEAAAQAFRKQVHAAQDQAILSGQPVGIVLTEGGYSLVQWRGKAWRAISRDVQLPRGLDLRRRDVTEKRPEQWPDLIFDATGVTQSADYRLSGRGVQIDIRLVETGEVEIETS